MRAWLREGAAAVGLAVKKLGRDVRLLAKSLRILRHCEDRGGRFAGCYGPLTFGQGVFGLGGNMWGPRWRAHRSWRSMGLYDLANWRTAGGLAYMRIREIAETERARKIAS